MNAGWTLLLLAALGAEPTSYTLQETIRDRVKRYGSLEVIVLKEYSPVDLPTLVAHADLVVRGVVTGSKSFLTAEHVITDYSVQVLSLVRGEGVEGRVIVVRRDGGSVSIDGGKIDTRESDFPSFEITDEYVLFLKRAPEGYHVVSHGAQGAFRIEGGSVAQVSREHTWNQERGRVEVLRFLSEIAAAVKQEKPPAVR